jgi:hypothetical protein
MVTRKSLLSRAAVQAAASIIDRLRARLEELGEMSRRLDTELEHQRRRTREQREACSKRREALQEAFREASRKADGAEATFRLSVELDRALAAVEEQVAAAERDNAAAEARIEKESAQLSDMKRAYREMIDALERERFSSYGLAPWDDAALRALALLDGSTKGEVAVGGSGEATLIRAGEVVKLFKERTGISRSLFYAEYRPLILGYPLGPTGLVRHPDGSFELVGYNKGIRFRRAEVEALITFLGGSSR